MRQAAELGVSLPPVAASEGPATAQAIQRCSAKDLDEPAGNVAEVLRTGTRTCRSCSAQALIGAHQRIGALERSGTIAGRNSRALQQPNEAGEMPQIGCPVHASSAQTPRMVAPPMRVPCQPATEGLLDRPGYPGQRSLLENHRPQARDDRRSGRAAVIWARRRGRAAAWSKRSIKFK